MLDPQTLAWDDFKLVRLIAEAKGLAGAAERLGVNHSTVFRRLGQLEEAIGTKLFERHRTGYALTAAGEEMAALAERMDDDVAGFARKLAGQVLSPAGELRVTTNDTLLTHLLTPLFARFCQQCPDVRLDVVLSNQALNLSKRDADVAIRATDTPPETLVGRRAATLAWALYGRAADFPQPGTLDLPTLSAHAWVALGDNLGAVKAARFVRERVAPERIVYKVNTVLGLTEAVESRDRHRTPALLHRRCAAGAGAPRAAEPGFLHRPVAAHPSRPPPFGAGAGVPRLPRRRDRKAAQVSRGRRALSRDAFSV